MNRRSFLKRLGSLLAVAYVAPTALIPKPVDAYVTVKEAEAYYLTVTADCTTQAYSLDAFSENIIRPAAIKLAEDIDAYILDKLLKER